MGNKDLILVYYIGVAMIRSADIPEYVRNVTKNILLENFEGSIIVIPVQTMDSRVECINPRYITDENLIKEHTERMKKLEEELKKQEIIINNKNKLNYE